MNSRVSFLSIGALALSSCGSGNGVGNHATAVAGANGIEAATATGQAAQASENPDCVSVKQFDGPDTVLGVKLGMPLGDAVKIIKCQFPTAGADTSSGVVNPWRANGSEGINIPWSDSQPHQQIQIWWLGSENHKTVIAVRREINYNEKNAVPVEKIKQGLKEKYGETYEFNGALTNLNQSLKTNDYVNSYGTCGGLLNTRQISYVAGGLHLPPEATACGRVLSYVTYGDPVASAFRMILIDFSNIAKLEEEEAQEFAAHGEALKAEQLQKAQKNGQTPAF